MNIGKSIKEMQHRTGMTNKELAKRTQVTTVYVSLLRGRRTCSGYMMEKLAEVFDMSVSEFVSVGEDN